MKAQELLRKARNYYVQFVAVRISLDGSDIGTVFDKTFYSVPFMAAAYKYIIAYYCESAGYHFHVDKVNIDDILKADSVPFSMFVPQPVLLAAQDISKCIEILTTADGFCIDTIRSMDNVLRKIACIISKYLQIVEHSAIDKCGASVRIIGSYNKDYEFDYLMSCSFKNYEKESLKC